MADISLLFEATGVNKVTGAVESIRDSFTDAEKRHALFNKAALGFVGIAATFATTAAAMGKVVTGNGDRLAKLSQQTGVAVEQLSALEYAADMSGVSQEMLGNSFKFLNKNMYEASQGNVKLKEAFEKLNVATVNSDGSLRDTNEVFLDTADALSKLPDGAEKTSLAMLTMGEAGSKMIPLLNSGRDGITAMTDEASQLGLVMGTDAAKSSEVFNDAVSKLTKMLYGLWNTALQPIIPIIAELTDSFATASKESSLFDTAIAAVSGTLKAVIIAASIVKNAFDALIGSIVAAAKAAYLASQGEFKKAWEALKEGGAGIVEDFNDVAETIDRVMKTSAKKVEASNKSITNSTKAMAKSVTDSAVSMDKAWELYNENVEINNKARSDQEKQIAKDLEIAWAEYYRSLDANNKASAEKAENTYSGMWDALNRGFSRGLASQERTLQNGYQRMADYAESTFSYITDSFGNAVANWIVYGEGFDLNHVFQTMAAQFISAMIAMAAQFTVLRILVATGAVEMAASGVIVNIAWAPFTLTVLAIAAAIALVVYAIKNWRDESKDTARVIIAAFAPVILTIEAIYNAVNWLIRQFEKLEKVMGKIKGLWDDINPLGALGSPNQWGFDIPGFATGGSFITSGPRLFVAGENGPERVTVSPAGTPASMGGSGGNRTSVYFTGPTVFDSITARRFSRLINRYGG